MSARGQTVLSPLGIENAKEKIKKGCEEEDRDGNTSYRPDSPDGSSSLVNFPHLHYGSEHIVHNNALSRRRPLSYPCRL